MENVELLSRLGLNAYEARAYVALLRRGSSTAAQVAQLGGLPRQRAYDVLAALVRKGLASSRPGKAVKFTPTAPKLAIERLLGEHRHALLDLERDAERATQRLTSHYLAGQKHTDPLDYIEVLRAPGRIAERWDELQRRARSEILVFAKPPYVTPAQDNTVGMLMAGRRTTRCVYELGAFDDPAFLEGIRRFARAGEEARFVAELPLKMAIIDDRMVLFAMNDPAAGPAATTTLVVEHPALASALRITFESVWLQGVTFEEAKASLETATAPSRAPRTRARAQ